MESPVNNQTADQTLKGAILGLVSWIAVKAKINPADLIGIMPIVSAALAYASTHIGDKNVASFFAKAQVQVDANASAVVDQVKTKEAK